MSTVVSTSPSPRKRTSEFRSVSRSTDSNAWSGVTFEFPDSVVPDTDFYAQGLTSSDGIFELSTAVEINVGNTGDEVVHRDGAATVRALGDERAAEGDHDGSPVPLRVGVAERPDEGAAVADARVGDERCSGGHDRRV